MAKRLIILLGLLFSINSFAGGFSVSVNSMVTASVTTASTQVMAADPYRNYLLIQNLGSATVYVKFGSAQSGNEGVNIIAGGSYEPIKGVFDSIYIRSASGTQSVLILSGE